MFKSVPEGITVSDLNGTILETNEATVNIHGYDNKEELIGKSAFELIAEKDHGQAMENLKDELEKDNIKTVEYSFLRKNGSEFPAELTAARLRDGAGNPIGFVAVTRDITERKRVEEAIRQSEERLRLLVESTEDAVVMIDLEGRTIYFNAAKKHGLEDKAVLGNKFSELFDSETVTSMSQQFREVVENGKATIVERQLNLMGQELWFSEQLSPVRNSEGQIIATVLISRNSTEQKKMQEQLILTDRLASIG
jgi:PAS domain S-box-containing protein